MGKGRILIVDDESILRMDIHEMLIQAGYDVIGEAGNGEDAVEMALSLVPDLIVMDVKMPKMNGIKASRLIGKTSNIPILLLTAYSQAKWIEEAKEACIVGYLVKPILESDLIPAIGVALAQGRRLTLLKRNVQYLESKLESRKRIERAKGIAMKGLNCNEEEAYSYLRNYSMRQGMSIDEVASLILKDDSFIHQMLIDRHIPDGMSIK
jgi:AmiR/NasT family two-component response regulator